MAAKTSRYDGDLQMFTEAPREPRLAELRFLRWLAEQGQLEHRVFGPSVGRYAIADVVMSERTDVGLDWPQTG